MMFLVEATALKRSSLRADPNHRAPSPDPHLQRLLLDVDPLHQELDDPRLLGREQFVPDHGEVGEQNRNLALGDLVISSRRRRPGPRHDFRRGQQLLDAVQHRAVDVRRRHARHRAGVAPVRHRG
jgi:hypothetical protein